eukprot:TRINITY_DN103368_c0_g1_i1.p1 TRINITY_DN103368_c0_g1~~TRINITY_DN103368_c0_g1_i1.p1  ORF type:complete len:331 (+),score=123.79 TRINITY_DN103368_c0_g1_i1:117-1109(+)
MATTPKKQKTPKKEDKAAKENNGAEAPQKTPKKATKGLASTAARAEHHFEGLVSAFYPDEGYGYVERRIATDKKLVKFVMEHYRFEQTTIEEKKIKLGMCVGFVTRGLDACGRLLAEDLVVGTGKVQKERGGPAIIAAAAAKETTPAKEKTPKVKAGAAETPGSGAKRKKEQESPAAPPAKKQSTGDAFTPDRFAEELGHFQTLSDKQRRKRLEAWEAAIGEAKAFGDTEPLFEIVLKAAAALQKPVAMAEEDSPGEAEQTALRKHMVKALALVDLTEENTRQRLHCGLLHVRKLIKKFLKATGELPSATSAKGGKSWDKLAGFAAQARD